MSKTILTKDQQKIVEASYGPLRIIAGPGSGKTRVLTHRLVHLVEEGLEPWKIVALTFTNMASKEMRERVELMLDGRYATPHISTYHSFCFNFLKQWGEIDHLKEEFKIDKNFDILDRNGQNQILRRIYRDIGITTSDVPYKVAYSYLPMRKRAELFKDYKLKNEPPKMLERIFYSYNDGKKQMNVLDFDDLIMFTRKTLDEFEEVKRKWQNKISYLLVDEFQDTSYDQYVIVKHLVNKERPNIFIVGDPFQTIYTWRGAKSEYLTSAFDNDFKNVKTYSLVENFRSGNQIVKAANAIRQNINIKLGDSALEDLVAKREVNGKLNFYLATTQITQSLWIANKIIDLQQNGCRLSEICILYRTNRESASIEKQLRLKSIPYKVHGAFAFLDRKEVQDAIAYLSLINGTIRDHEMERVLATPRKGIGEVKINLAYEMTRSLNISLYDAFSPLHRESLSLMTKAKESLNVLSHALDKVKHELKINKAKIGDAFNKFLEEIGFFGIFKGELTEDERKENIEELIQGMNMSFDQNDEMTLSKYIEKLRLLEGREDVVGRETVSLMTFHKAKGKEYQSVFVTSLIDGHFPSKSGLDEENGQERLQEEWRLFYVAITRAKNSVYLSSYESLESSNEVSRFVYSLENLIPDPLYKKRTITHKKPSLIITKKPSKEQLEKFKVGSVVEHKMFGKGTVVESYGSRIYVNFKGYGKVNVNVDSKFWS